MPQPPRRRFDELLPPPLREVLQGIERRNATRAPTGLRFVVADQLDGVNPLRWDEVAGTDSLFLRRDYLSALERARLPNVSHRYSLVFDGERPVVAMAMQIIDVGVDRFHAADERLVAGLDTDELERSLRQRVLVCGNMLSSGRDGIAIAEGIDHSLAYRAVGEALYRVRRAEKLNGHTNLVMVKDFVHDAVDESRGLEGLSYRLMEGGASMVLEVESSWRTHEDYLASMVSKYRSAVKRKVFAPITEAGCRVVQLTPEQVERHASRMQELHLAVQDNAKVRPVTVSERYWPEMARLDGCVFNAVLRGDEVLGFLLVQVDGSGAHAAQIGFDREAATTLPLYLRLLHTAVETGLQQKCSRVVLGRTALEPKARMGAKPEPTFMWVRHRVPVVNALTRGLVDLVRHEPAPDIDPFKQ